MDNSVIITMGLHLSVVQWTVFMCLWCNGQSNRIIHIDIYCPFVYGTMDSVHVSEVQWIVSMCVRQCLCVCGTIDSSVITTMELFCLFVYGTMDSVHVSVVQWILSMCLWYNGQQYYYNNEIVPILFMCLWYNEQKCNRIVPIHVFVFKILLTVY